MTDKTSFYCPTQDRANGSVAWQLDGAPGTTGHAKLQQIISRTGGGNPWTSNSSTLGYSNFMHGSRSLKQTDAGITWASDSGARVEYYWRAPTLEEFRDTFNSDTAKGRDISPLMFACTAWCTSGGAGFTAHGGPDEIPDGVNGVMLDGSARWIDEQELRGIMRDEFPTVAFDVNPWGSEPVRLRFENHDYKTQNANPGNWSGGNIRFYSLVRYGLRLSRER